MNWGFIYNNVAGGGSRSSGELGSAISNIGEIDLSVYKNASLKTKGLRAAFFRAVGTDMVSDEFDRTKNNRYESNFVREIAKQRGDGSWDIICKNVRVSNSYFSQDTSYSVEKRGLSREEAAGAIENFNARQGLFNVSPVWAQYRKDSTRLFNFDW